MMDEEKLRSLAFEQPVTQESDLSGVMKTLNEDVIEKGTGFSSIDTKTRLTFDDVRNITVHDTIIALQCLPTSCLATTRVKKRLAVSIKGLGREEMVRLVQGQREHMEGQSSGGFFNKLKSVVLPKQ